MNIQPKDNSRGHFYISLIKSGFRIIAGVALIIAELLGVAEELV